MKKSLYVMCFILLILSFINTTYAKQNLILDEPVIEFERDKNFKLQGFTNTDKYLFMVMVGYNDSKSIIKVYDLDTKKEIRKIDGNSLGHANDITYNRKDNKIYVLASSGSTKVFKFDADSFLYEGSFDIELPARSITYIEDEDIYAIRTVSVGYLLNNKFELISKVPFIFGMNFNIDIGRQGWSYYNGNIYYANWSWVRYGGDGANIVYIYNLDGKIVETLYTDNSIGEMEDVSFYKNKMILGFNGYDKKIKFYMIDVPDFETVVAVDEPIIEDEGVYTFWYDYVHIGICCFLILGAILFIVKIIKK